MGTVSKLTSGTYIAAEGNYEHGRAGQKICKFTPHHMAGILTGKQCAVNIFQKVGREASANYCIGNDGDIVCNVYEEDRAYTSSSRVNDRQAITVEVSNCEVGGEWKVSDKAWNSLVNLAEDVCRRYGFRLNYDGTKNGSLTNHDMFANTNCPGPYLKGKMQELADIVNARLDGNSEQNSEDNNVNSNETNDNQNTDIFNDGLVNCIYDIQEWLNRHYNTRLALDNIYGPKTKAALIRGLQTELNTQYKKGLAVDGIFGIKTKNACINVKQGAQGNITMLIQMALFIKRYNIDMDKKFGSKTAKIVGQFQSDNGLTVDKICGKNTFEKLFA